MEASFKMRTHRHEKGQATAELTVAMVGMVAVLCGFILISKLSISNVENILTARGDADGNAITSTLGDGGDAILSWNEGADDYLYTADDIASVGTLDNPALFRGELQNDDFSLRTDFSMPYVSSNFAPTIGPLYIFQPSATLTSGSCSAVVTLDDLSRLLYVDTPSITLTDNVFMPIMSGN